MYSSRNVLCVCQNKNKDSENENVKLKLIDYIFGQMRLYLVVVGGGGEKTESL